VFEKRSVCSSFYEGSAPLSEKETQVFMDFLGNSGVEFDIAFNLFSRYNALYVPLTHSQKSNYNNEALYDDEADLSIF